MISIKKAVFTFFAGTGLALALVAPASAIDGCNTCAIWLDECSNGNAASCASFNRYHCYFCDFNPQ